MSALYRDTLKAILILSLLLPVPVNNFQISNQEEQFTSSIEYWTEVLCTLEKTKTIIFHGIFLNGSRSLQDYFNVLLRATSESCGVVVLPKIYTSPNFPRDDSSSIGNSNTLLNVNVSQQPKLKDYEAVKGEGIRRLISTTNILRSKWNIKRYWRRDDDYYTNVWTVNIIFLGDHESFEKLLDSDMGSQLNSREHFIVLAVWNDRLANLDNRIPLIDRTLRKLWLDYQILNVYFDEPLSTSRGNIRLYSYNPFAINGEKGRGQLEFVDGSSKRRMLRSLSTLTYRRAIDFNGYRFNVSIFDQVYEGIKIRGEINPYSIYVYSGGYSGPSGILLGVLAKKLNFVVNAIEPNTNERYGHQMENGTLSGAVGDVVYRRVVASFASFFVKKYADDMSGMEFTTASGFDQVCVIAPKAAKIPKGLRMFYIFESNVWLCLIGSYILVNLTWHYVQVLSPVRPRSGRKHQTHLLIFYVCMGYPISLPSRISERYILFGIFFCGITLVGIFSGMLYKSFATDMFYKDINNLAELDASELPIGFASYSTSDLFGSKDDPDLSPVFKNLQKKMIHVPDALKTAAFNRNVTGLLRDQYFSLIHESLIDETGTHMLHRVKECPAKFYLACLLPSNSFLRERINIMIGRLNQAGLPELWRSHTVLQGARKTMANIQKSQKFKKQVFVPFNLNDLQMSFVILGVGLSTSTIVFFTEKGWIKFCFKRKSTISPAK